jgi:uncharacterized phiE125 gp8 family phage protein
MSGSGTGTLVVPVITPVEPITLAEAASNLSLDPDDGNSPPGYVQGSRILRLITAARVACEQELEMSLVAKTLEIAHESFMHLSRHSHYGSRALMNQYDRGYNWNLTGQNPYFPRNSIQLPDGPVRSIVSVNYLDSDGVDTVLASNQYRLSTSGRMAMLWPAYGVSWPSCRTDVDSVRVRYAVGYPSADSPPQEVPEPIRQAMHLFIGHYFANRDAADLNTLAELPLGVRYLLGKYRKNLGV